MKNRFPSSVILSFLLFDFLTTIDALVAGVSKSSVAYDFGVCNIPGVDWKRPKKVNQDAWFHDDGERGYSIVGVLDGHGTLGHELSEYFASNLAFEIRQQLSSDLEPVPELELRIKDLAGYKCDAETTLNPPIPAMINAFHAVHWNAMKDPNLKTGRNGSTCIVCFINEVLKCHVAYVGDSRAICFGDDVQDRMISVVAEETTVRLSVERDRIEAGEGSIRGDNVFYGPVGIAMTRVLGDAVMIRAGVIPTPSVNTVQIEKGDFLVLATDGIWEVLTNDNVRDIVFDCGGAQNAAEEIAKKAKDRWVGDLPIMDEERADDITVMVLHWERDD